MLFRSVISQALFEHVTNTGGLTLCLYDVTTLYFETEREDDLRRVGYSKERRVDPQVIVGLLVDRGGFPLQVGCWEGNRAETTTIIPMVEAFQAAHGIEELVIVADAGMLSAANLKSLDEAHLRFIVGARQVRAPGDPCFIFSESPNSSTYKLPIIELDIFSMFPNKILIEM